MAVFIVLAVGISGFMVYNSLTQIVSSLQYEASSDYRLVVIKNISLDLMEIENNIQLYSLTQDQANRQHYQSLNKRLKERVAVLEGLSDEKNEASVLSDSVKYFVEAKIRIWDEIRHIKTISTDPQPKFDELYSKLEQKQIDTLKVEVAVEPVKKKGFLRRIFGKKDTVQMRVDTTFVERTVENEQIKEEIEQLETELKETEERKNKRELQLVKQNILITGQLNNLIARIEKAERDDLIIKSEEKNQLATFIYKRLSAFSVLAVALLFIVLYLFVRYLNKARKYQLVLSEAKLESERLAKAKEVFMANVSHEMRTPVNAIYGLAEQLLDHDAGEEANEKLGVLLHSAEHLRNVVNDTLDFSKIQARKLNFEEVDFSPASIIKEVLDLLRHDAHKKGIDIEFRSINDLPDALIGDPLRLKQILINTIGNAVKFTTKGEVILTTETISTEHSGVKLKFKVKDTGIGISEENLKHIFEDFVQVETDYTRSFSGTGLGLSIVKSLIELQRGKISIESELDKGTTLTFHIPYKLGDVSNIKKLVKPDIMVPEEIRGLKILGIDDEEFNRYLLKVIFDKWGVEFFDGKNGNEAVEKALNTDFDLILMDLRMPEMNGIDASKAILKEKPESKIVAVAAIKGEAELNSCKEAGILHYLTKPYSEEELLDVITTVMQIDKENIKRIPDFSLEELERLADGDKSFMEEMIKIFIRSSQMGMENIKDAFANNNAEFISEAAHKMAAPCKHIMADELYSKIKDLEKKAAKAESVESLSSLVQDIELLVERITNSLSEILESTDQ